MKYKLISKLPPYFDSAKKQILINRGISAKDLDHYMNLTDADISKPLEDMYGVYWRKAATTFFNHVLCKSRICVIVDADCDGYTSAAIILNYMYDLVLKTEPEDPQSSMDNIDFFHHESKQHGLADAMEWINQKNPELVIVPDGGSNDITQLKELEDKGIDVIILDHHLVENIDFWSTEYHPHLYLINSQVYYPNKELSGAGVAYQFCKVVDSIYFRKDCGYADNYLDLVALGNVGDMMSLKSFETRRLITKGLQPENIKNPFIYEMWQKNKFKLGDAPTAWGVTFYIVPLVNAITRSGTLEEKKLIFSSMLKYKAFNFILSNKRGHKVGETEKLVDQAIRTCTNVKNRQTRAETQGLELIEHLIKDNNMMDHKVLLFLMKPGQIQPEIRGLCANKIMAKYQRPCCILTETVKNKDIIIQADIASDGAVHFNPTGVHTGTSSPKDVARIPGTEEYICYEGSARGCDKVGVTEFKDICAETGVCEYTVGHEGAFGLGIRPENIDTFIAKTDETLKNMASEPIYYVDYIWSANNVNAEKILEIADMDDLWGKDIDESLIAIEDIKVTKDNISMMASNTVKITLPNNISIIKFNMPDEEYNKLYTENGYVAINIVGKANKNEWNGNISAQVLLTDYEIIGQCAYIF